VTLVDTNVVLDIAGNDERWSAWSLAQLKASLLVGPLLINDVIYAELAVPYGSIEELDATLVSFRLRLDPMPRQALFSAAKAFKAYRVRGGTRTGILPDFFIGAHAETLNCTLLTRDAARYRTYFPSLKLIVPD
jgi:predicted nucleic acid-binding protein